MTTEKRKKKTAYTPSMLAAIILAALLAVSVALSCALIFGTGRYSGSAAATNEASTEDNFVIEQSEDNGIALNMVSLTSESNDSGITTYSSTATVNGSTITYESSYSITATLSPSGASGSITWTLSCSYISDISSYVVLSSSTSASGESITVYCLKAFSYQITLTATSGSVSSSCSLNYIKKVTRIYVYYYCNPVEDDDDGYWSLSGYGYSHLAFSSNSAVWWGYPDVGYGSLLTGTIITSSTWSNYTGSYDNLLIYGNDYEYSYVYSAGTITDTFSDPTFTVTLNSEIASVIGVKTNTYTITDWGINTDDIFNSMFGVTNAMSNSTYKTKVYNAGLTYGTADWFTVTATFTGQYKTYSLSNSVYFRYSIYK